MMRQLTDHKANPLNDQLEIAVLDQPGAGGANHLYRITGADPSRNPSLLAAAGTMARFTLEDGADEAVHHVDILFQNGPINEHGINGLTQEVLLAIVIDRLRSFQAGPFTCDENDQALHSAELSLFWLKQRPKDRTARGVEGKSEH